TNYISSLIRWVNTYNRSYPANLKIPDGYVPSPGLMKDWKLPPDLKLPANYVYGCPPGVEPTITPPLPGMPSIPGSPSSPAGTPSCIPQPIMISGGNVPPAPQMR